MGLTLLVFALSAPAYSQGTRIDLGDIAAGGDGSGTASPDVIGIHPDTGFLDSFFIDGPIGIADAIALQPVDPSVSPFIDAVFIIDSEEMTINTAGVKFPFEPDDVLQPALTWGQILKNRVGGEVGTPISIGGVSFESGVGIHATAGITYDLTEIRDVHGEINVGEVTAVAGIFDSISAECLDRGFVRTYVILSDEENVLASASHVASSGGEALRLPIPPGAMFLTLASGAGASLDRDPRFFCNSGTFGDAVIVSGGHVFRRGDSDTNGAINLTDVVRILNALFLGIGTITCDDAADADDNGIIDLTDAIAILNRNFLGVGNELPLPGGEICGPDPTGDSIDCAAYEASC